MLDSLLGEELPRKRGDKPKRDTPRIIDETAFPVCEPDDMPISKRMLRERDLDALDTDEKGNGSKKSIELHKKRIGLDTFLTDPRVQEVAYEQPFDHPTQLWNDEMPVNAATPIDLATDQIAFSQWWSAETEGGGRREDLSF